MMHTIAAQMTDARNTLKAVAGGAAAIEARVLAQHAWNLTPEMLVRDANELRDRMPYQQLVARRLRHEPVSHITGGRHFWKNQFYVTADVLTPRADSETLIETLLRLRPETTAALHMLDLGTGSGCLLLSALHEYPESRGVGVDQSLPALQMAARNAAALRLQHRVMLRRSNWCEHLEGTFDVVLANPPYIPRSHAATLAADVHDYEPHVALFGGEDGLDSYRTILQPGVSGQCVIPHLKPKALLLFEVGLGQAAEVAALGTAQGLYLIDIVPDLAGIARVVAFQHSTRP